MSACHCDYEPPSVYVATKPKARAEHRCTECGSKIARGETYERVFAVWDGYAQTCKTCARCLDLRAFVTSFVPCFCWAHNNLHQDARDCAEAWGHEAPGLQFGTLRRIYNAKGGRH
jgi:hypothetical protein